MTAVAARGRSRFVGSLCPLRTRPRPPQRALRAPGLGHEVRVLGRQLLVRARVRRRRRRGLGLARSVLVLVLVLVLGPLHERQPGHGLRCQLLGAKPHSCHRMCTERSAPAPAPGQRLRRQRPLPGSALDSESRGGGLAGVPSGEGEGVERGRAPERAWRSRCMSRSRASGKPTAATACHHTHARAAPSAPPHPYTMPWPTHTMPWPRDGGLIWVDGGEG